MRIITGKAKGTRLKTPKGASTRPTADRVRESVFSILGDITGVLVLDLFAGTGSLGLEALSRGAAGAFFVDKATFDLLRENLLLCRLQKGEVFRRDVFSALSAFEKEGRVFDLVFCDPPYHQGLVGRVLERISPLLAAGGLFVAEMEAEEEAPSCGLELARKVGYGRTAQVLFYKKPLEARHEKSCMYRKF